MEPAGISCRMRSRYRCRMNLRRIDPVTRRPLRQEAGMRASPIIVVGAMLGAVSLAVVGAVSTISQARHDGFSLAGDTRPAPNGRIRQTPVSGVTTTIAPLAASRVANAMDDDRDR